MQPSRSALPPPRHREIVPYFRLRSRERQRPYPRSVEGSKVRSLGPWVRAVPELGSMRYARDGQCDATPWGACTCGVGVDVRGIAVRLWCFTSRVDVRAEGAPTRGIDTRWTAAITANTVPSGLFANALDPGMPVAIPQGADVHAHLASVRESRPGPHAASTAPGAALESRPWTLPRRRRPGTPRPPHSTSAIDARRFASHAQSRIAGVGQNPLHRH